MVNPYDMTVEDILKYDGQPPLPLHHKSDKTLVRFVRYGDFVRVKAFYPDNLLQHFFIEIEDLDEPAYRTKTTVNMFVQLTAFEVAKMVKKNHYKHKIKMGE